VLPAFDAIAARIPHLPDTPGVYLWKDSTGHVLYVGKAKRLRSRVRSYVAADAQTSVKTQHMLRQVADLETILVPSEAHALILEASLIKEHHPRYNIALRDDKSYPYIKVTLQEPFPRVFVTRQIVDDGGRYFGPYTDVARMRRALNVVKQLFTVRSCRYDLLREAPARPCLDYYIKRCQAPCVLLQSQADYRSMIDEVVAFLDGRTAEVMARVRRRMATAAEQLDFERAAELRDVLERLTRLEEPTAVLEVEGGDRDVVGYARDGDDAAVVILRVRGGRLLARDHRMLGNLEDEPDTAALSAYLARTYAGGEGSEGGRSGELLVPFDFEDCEALQAALPGTQVRVPQRGPRRALVDLAEQNARHVLEEFKLAASDVDERAGDPVYELQRELGLQRIPRSLVCMDVSHAQGTDTVASLVWFENGRPRRAEYRKFKIRREGHAREEKGESREVTRGEVAPAIDDFASIGEVVTRYFRRRIDEEKPLPDLVVIDGGKGQLNAAHAALEALGIGEIPLISLAKREEQVFAVGRTEPVRLARRAPGLRLLQRARDEAHRFAVTFQRHRRSARTVTSELLRVPGIGPARRRQLLRAFGSVQGVRDAGAARIAELPGFTTRSAERVLAALAAPAGGAT
jgi:excinuclease ABC subunit C